MSYACNSSAMELLHRTENKPLETGSKRKGGVKLIKEMCLAIK